MNVKDVPISKLKTDANYRTNLALDDEFVASVKLHGILQPLLVAHDMTVVAGHRRLAAAKKAKLQKVPCVMLGKILPEDAALVGIIENTHRRDVPAIDEARAVRALLDGGVPMAHVAKSLSRSKAYCARIVTLTRLQPETVEALHTGAITLDAALQIARLGLAPSEELQALEAARVDGEAGPLTSQGVRALLDRHFTRRLAAAPFVLTDTGLGAPACVKCPKRSAAQPLLFDEAPADTCLDSACWAGKAEMAWARVREQTPDQVLPDDPARFTAGGVLMDAKYVDLDATVVPGGTETWGAVLQDAEVLYARDPAGRVHRLARKPSKAKAQAIQAEAKPAAAGNVDGGKGKPAAPPSDADRAQAAVRAHRKTAKSMMDDVTKDARINAAAMHWVITRQVENMWRAALVLYLERAGEKPTPGLLETALRAEVMRAINAELPAEESTRLECAFRVLLDLQLCAVFAGAEFDMKVPDEIRALHAIHVGEQTRH